MMTLAYPWLFLLLPLPWILSWVRRRRLPSSSSFDDAALYVPFFNRLTQLVRESSSKHTFSWSKMLAYAGWGCLVFAATNPQWLGDAIQIPQKGRDIMLAIDLSGSMQLPDMVIDRSTFDRLTAVKAVAKQFIEDRVGDRVGLIVFGSKAYLQTPLTFDHTTVNAMLEDATIGLAGPQTALGDAIGLAVKHHQNDSQERSVLVLLTDGANNSGSVSPLEAAKMAAERNLRIYTIGVGADKLLIQGLFGPQQVNPSADLDETTLKAIAKTTGGQYFRAKDPAGLQQIYNQLNQLEPVGQDLLTLRPAVSLYYWPLAMALLLSVFMALSQLMKKAKLKLFVKRSEGLSAAKLSTAKGS